MGRALFLAAVLALALASGAIGDDSDTTPPVITPAVSGTTGANDWYTSNVTVTWSVADPESGIANSSGCDETKVSRETGSPMR